MAPPVSGNLMIENENMRHSKKKNIDHSLLKIHANKDIIIHAKKDRHDTNSLT